jgi:hypothetical protein
MRRLILMLLACFCLIAAAASVAVADTAVSNAQKLRIQVDPNASGCATAESSASWVTGTDSPLDSNSRYLAVHVGTGGCVILYSNASLRRSIAASNQKNLSYERNGSVTGLGQFYMVAQFGNGDVAFLDPYNCHHNIATAPAWQRTDITGFRSNCAFNVSGPNTTGGFTDFTCTTPGPNTQGDRYFCADGTNTAWANYVAANPGTNVIQRYMVFSFQDHQMDRISLGVGKMYTRGNNVAVSCTTEASC